jgi:hypothetical protein
VFSGLKPFTISPEQCIQRAYNAIATVGWANDPDNKDWEVVKTQLIKSSGTQANTTTACKGISKVFQGSKSVLDFFSQELSQVFKVLIKLTPKDYVTDLAFPEDIITETTNESQPQLRMP